MQISLYNSLSRRIEPFTPLKENLVRIYSCGPTVYNFAHIGNMRAFLFADLLQRAMRFVGNYDVKWVMNITDIDDKTIRDSKLGSSAWLPEMGEQTEDPKENLRNFTTYYEQKFYEDIRSLGVNTDHFYANPRATDFIWQMQNLIKKIYDNGYAYISGGSVYFNVSKWAQADTYGRLKKIDWENFQQGSRVDADTYEREDASDFVLWKEQKEGEPIWEFELDGKSLPGRPGWHLECSTMEYEILELPFDIHTGGVDLKFPHHEDEIAQSKAGYGIDPNPFWCHNEFLEVEGKKMSKSLGNFFTIRDLVAKGLDTRDIRLAMLSAHYSTKYNFTFDGVESARKARLKVQDYIYKLFELSESDNIEVPDEKLPANQVFSELANDLHSPKALARLFEFINEFPANKLSDQSKKNVINDLERINGIFAVWEISAKPEEEIIIPSEIIELAEQRKVAKANKDYAAADALRKQIAELGYNVLDKKDSYDIIPINK